MKNIKFRAWDKEKKVFVKGMLCFEYDDFDWVLLNDNYEQILWNYNGELCQYTGLKDKNGVEIYEGDIVKTTSNKLAGKWKHKIYKIEFKEINCLAGAKYMGFDFQFNVDEVEVIGNIYENPELLK